MKVPAKTLYASYLPKVKDRNKILMADSGLLLDNGNPPKRNLLSSVPDSYLDNLDQIGTNSTWSMQHPYGGSQENAYGDFANSQMYGQPKGAPSYPNVQPISNYNSNINVQNPNFQPQPIDLNGPNIKNDKDPRRRQPYNGEIGQGLLTAASVADAIIPYGHIKRWPTVRPQVAPNQHPYGTGSQALMEYGGNMGHAVSWGGDGIMVPDAKSGIHIKPSHKGRFTAYKKRTGQTTEQALHSKNPHVRQMANFARNAKKWHHKEDGGSLYPAGGVVAPAGGPALATPAGLSGSMYGRVPSHVNAGPTKLHHKKLKFPDGGVIPKNKLKPINKSATSPSSTSQPYGNRYVAFPYGNAGSMSTTNTIDLQSAHRVGSPNERGYVNAYNSIDQFGNPGTLNDEQIPYQYLTGKNTNNFALEDAYNPNRTDSVYVAPGASKFGVHKPMAYGGTIEEAADGHWIQHAINPAHKGYCTPMTKATCTPRRKAFAMRAKHHDLADGGPVGSGPISFPASHLGQQLKKGKWHYPATGNSPKKFKSGGSLTPSKAAEILHDGTAQGHPITDKQRRFFGWKSHQKAPQGTSIPNDPYHFTTATKPNPGDPIPGTGLPDLPMKQSEQFTPHDREDTYLIDDINQELTTGVRTKAAGYNPQQQQMLNDAYLWRRVNNRNNPQANVEGYFNRPVDPNNALSRYRGKLNSIGYGAVSMLHSTPNVDVRMADGGVVERNDRMWNIYNAGGHFMDTTVWEHGGYTSQFPSSYGSYEDGGYAGYGGSYDDGGVIDTHWGGNAQPIAYNPYDGGTTQFNGDSHANGGIGMSYNGKQVEVEGGETAAKDRNGDLNVFGNMYLPGTKTKFKTAVKEIADKEKHFDTLKTNGTNTVNSLDPKNKYDQIKFNSAELMMKGGDQGQQELAKRKQQLADLQNSMLDTAKEFNLDPQGMSAGNLKKAKKGTFISGQTNMSSLSNKMKKAPFGIQIDGSPTNSGPDPENDVNVPTRSDRNNNPGNIKYGKYAKDQGATGQDKDHFAIFPDPTLGHTAMQNLLTGDSYKNLSVRSAINKWTGGKPYSLTGLGDLNNKKVSDLAPNELGHVMEYMRHGEGTAYGAIQTKIPSATPITGTPSSIIPIKPFGLPDAPAFNTPTPEAKPATPVQPNYLLGPVSPKKDIPTQAKPLGFNDVASDIFDIATNHERPVYAQKYIPQMYQPYQVSYQDRINANQESFNDIKKLVNPANPTALGSLSAQKYSADNAVRAEEFRTNQGISNQVYNENIGLSNEAQRTNLGIADQQFTRQEGANAKTREMNQMIVNSLSDKYNAVQARNNELRAYENLYNYRLQPNEKTGGLDETNYNPDAQFQFNNRPEQGGNNNDNRRTTVYNPNGSVRNFRDTKDSEVVNQYRELRNEMMKRKLDPNNPDNIKLMKGGKLSLLPAPKLFRGGYIKTI